MTIMTEAPASGTYNDPRGRSFQIESDMIRAGAVNIPASVLIGRDASTWRLTAPATATAGTTTNAATTTGNTRQVEAFVDLAIDGCRVVPVRQREGAWDAWDMAHMRFLRVPNDTSAMLFPSPDTYSMNHRAVLNSLVERCVTPPVVETVAAPVPDDTARRELERVYEALRTLDHDEREEVNSALGSAGLELVTPGARDVEIEMMFTANVTQMVLIPEQDVEGGTIPEQEIETTRSASFDLTLLLEGYESDNDACESDEANELVESWLNEHFPRGWDDLDYDRRRCPQC